MKGGWRLSFEVLIPRIGNRSMCINYIIMIIFFNPYDLIPIACMRGGVQLLGYGYVYEQNCICRDVGIFDLWRIERRATGRQSTDAIGGIFRIVWRGVQNWCKQ